MLEVRADSGRGTVRRRCQVCSGIDDPKGTAGHRNGSPSHSECVVRPDVRRLFATNRDERHLHLVHWPT
eukprot:8676707-Pyramimonas_sp.AAC.1